LLNGYAVHLSDIRLAELLGYYGHCGVFSRVEFFYLRLLYRSVVLGN
jgi:hypothetical protein